MKKQLYHVWLACYLLLKFSSIAAVNPVTVNVTATVSSIDNIVFSDNPSTLNVTPGTSPRTNSTTSYGIITNQTSRRISAALNSSLPTGISLSVSLAAPSGATSAGLVSVSTSSVNLVTGISRVNQTGLGVTYSVSATPLAAVTNGIVRTITYTLSS
jgi:hypothetical protein